MALRAEPEINAMKLFNVSLINSFSAASVKQDVKSKKASVHHFTSLCGRFTCTLKITDSQRFAAFTYKVTFKCAETNAIISKDKREAMSVADLKDTFKVIIQDANENNPELPEMKGNVKTEGISHTDKFASLPIGCPFACDLNDGTHINEAIKSGNETISFNHYGTIKTILFVAGMTCDPEWPTSPDYKLIQDPNNIAKQYILKRENFQEITVFQLIHGHQVHRVKLTETELLATYDFIYQYQLNKLLSSGSNSAARLYKIKQAYLDGISKNWRTDAKRACKSANTHGFMEHVQKERELTPLILRTGEAMRKTNSYARGGVKCWWCVPAINSVLVAAQEAGFISRMSTTQVHWTEAGIDALNKAKKNTFAFYAKAA